MIPVKSHATEVDNLKGLDEVEFTIGDARWVMRSMADLYSNRELAVIREYSTNAFDANKEYALATGKPVEPIIVSLPNAMNPYFSVQDYGVGMSEAELTQIYTKFGTSTKQDSNEFNGMLGMGSKSGVAYTNSFTVTSVKDGKKIVASVIRKPDYAIVLKILMRMDTNERNGVTIQIPVHNAREFEQKARDFYRFWKPGTVLVNGKEPEWAVGEKIGNDLFMYPRAGTSYIVMGNVPYRIANPDALFPRGMNKISFVAYVENGAVEFTPSREDLKYSEHTKKALHKIIDDFVATALQTAKTEIVAAKTHAEAYKLWTKWSSVVGRSNVDNLTFKGDKFIDRFSLIGHRYDSHSYRYGTWTIKEWEVGQMDNTIIVSDFDINLNGSHKRKVKDWMQATGRTARYIIFTESKTISSPWIDPARVVTWEKVKAEAPKAPKKPRAAVNSGRLAGTFDIITKAGREEEKDVPNTKELYYMMIRDYNDARNRGGNPISVLQHLDLDHRVVLVPANRKDKFLRNYPHAKEVVSTLFANKVELDGVKLISADGLKMLSMDTSEHSTLNAMDEKKILDPEIVALIKLAKVPFSDYLKEYEKHRTLAALLGKGNQFKVHPYRNSWDRKGKLLFKKYPLAKSFNSYGDKRVNEHVYVYMNACYQQARKDGRIV